MVRSNGGAGAARAEPAVGSIAPLPLRDAPVARIFSWYRGGIHHYLQVGSVVRACPPGQKPTCGQTMPGVGAPSAPND